MLLSRIEPPIQTENFSSVINMHQMKKPNGRSLVIPMGAPPWVAWCAGAGAWVSKSLGQRAASLGGGGGLVRFGKGPRARPESCRGRISSGLPIGRLVNWPFQTIVFFSHGW
jgi:hypothetical protein